jgi:PKD repeat protein
VEGVTGSGLAKDYLSEGSNAVYAIATNGSSCAVRSDNTATVTLHTLAPAVEFGAASYSYCGNAGKFSLHDLLNGADKEKVLSRQDGMSYDFTATPAGLTVSSGAYEVDPAQSTPQAYTVTLWVRRSGCEVSSTATLTILPIPAAFTVTASTSNVVCNSDPITVTASNAGVSGLTYQWYVNNALVDGVTNSGLAKDYLSQGSNAIYAIATNGSRCAVRSDNTVTATLHTLAPAVEFSNPPYAYCANADKFSLLDLLTGSDKDKVLNNQDGMSYEFVSSPAGLSVDNTFGTYRVDPAQSTPQAYAVTLVVRRSGCEVSRTATLTINVAPGSFNLTTTKPSTVVDGQTVYLLCNSSSFDAATTAPANTASVEWYLGANSIATTAQGSSELLTCISSSTC